MAYPHVFRVPQELSRGNRYKQRHCRQMRFETLEERHLLASLTVNSPLDIKMAGDGLVTLREAIIAANTNTTTDLGQTGSGADTIEFAPAVSGTIALSFGELLVTESLTINGPGRDILAIDAQQNSRIFNLTTAAANSTIRGLTLTGGYTTGQGGAVRSGRFGGTLTIDQCTISGNTAAGRGGGLYSESFLQITGSTISSNKTTGTYADGGGFFSWLDLTLTNSTVSDNNATGRGGGFMIVGNFFSNHNGHAVINNSIIHGNTALHNGGGLFALYATVTSSEITANETSDSGGGIYTSFSRGQGSTFVGSTVSGNRAMVAGGGIWSRYSVRLHNSTFAENTGGGIHSNSDVELNSSSVRDNIGSASGGGIHMAGNSPGSGGNLILNTSSLTGNRSTGAGGGAHVRYGNVTLNSSTVSNNISGVGGGIACTRIVTVNSSTISGNRSGTTGGGIDGGTVTLNSSTVSGNLAMSTGGGIHAAGDISVKHSTIAGNEAISGIGGGISNSSGTVEVVASILADNSAGGGNADLAPGTGALNVQYSLVGDNIGTPLAEAQTADGNGNLIGSSASGGAIDPLLGPLADNSGPTQTHALLPGSPAIDAIPTGAGLVPAHDYQLNGSFSDSAGGPSLTQLGGSLTSSGYAFGPNKGLDLTSALPNPAQYSIEVRFRWDSLSGGWQKIIDFHNLTSDVGLYTAGSGLHFLNRAFTSNLFLSNTLHRVIVTRDDATDIVRGYVDGVEAWNFVDTAGEAVFDAANQIIRFFQDDNATGQSEAQSGFVDLIRIYNQVLTAAEVLALQAPPPVAVPTFDQRGNPFVRIANGDGVPGSNIDMGAYESQGVPSFSPGDYNQNGIVDAADYVLWRKGLGTTYTPNDYGVWRSNFGRLLVIASPGTSSFQTQSLIAKGEAAGHATVVESAAPLHSATAIDLVRFEQTSRLSEGRFRATGEVAASYTESVSGGLASWNGQWLLLASSYGRGGGWDAVIHEVTSKRDDTHVHVIDHAFAGMRSDKLQWAYIAEGLILSDA